MAPLMVFASLHQLSMPELIFALNFPNKKIINDLLHFLLLRDAERQSIVLCVIEGRIKLAAGKDAMLKNATYRTTL